MEYTIRETYTRQFDPAVNCYILEYGDTVYAGDPNGGECCAQDWGDLRRQLRSNGLGLDWLDYDAETGMDEYMVIFELVG